MKKDKTEKNMDVLLVPSKTKSKKQVEFQLGQNKTTLAPLLQKSCWYSDDEFQRMQTTLANDVSRLRKFLLATTISGWYDDDMAVTFTKEEASEDYFYTCEEDDDDDIDSTTLCSESSFGDVMFDDDSDDDDSNDDDESDEIMIDDTTISYTGSFTSTKPSPTTPKSTKKSKQNKKNRQQQFTIRGLETFLRSPMERLHKAKRRASVISAVLREQQEATAAPNTVPTTKSQRKRFCHSSISSFMSSCTRGPNSRKRRRTTDPALTDPQALIDDDDSDDCDDDSVSKCLNSIAQASQECSLHDRTLALETGRRDADFVCKQTCRT